MDLKGFLMILPLNQIIMNMDEQIFSRSTTSKNFKCQNFFEKSTFSEKKSFFPPKSNFFGQNFPKYKIPGYPGITPRVEY